MRRHILQTCHGSTFISAAMASGIFAILMAGFLAYMANEFNLNNRSHGWNRALNLAEAGIDIAYSELNYQYYQGGSGFQSSRGWTSVSSSTYSNVVTNFFGADNFVVGTFTVVVSGVGTPNPSILSVGTFTPVKSGSTIRRAIQATVTASSRFPVGIMSRSTVNMNGNNIYTDSYDSTDTNKSTNGQYDATKRQPNGSIASDSTITNTTVNIGNANIYGMAYTGPGGSVSMGPNGTVGNSFTNQATSVATATADGYIESDFSVDVPDVVLPSGLSTAASLGAINNSQTITGGSGATTNKFQTSSINLNGNGGKVITIVGNVALYVTGSVGLSGNAEILISSNSSLSIYCAGSVSLSGNGVVNNATSDLNNQWYGLPSSTSWSFTGNANFTGTVYAPEAAFSLKGGGANGDMSGGIVANTITLSGQVQFHYDEALKKSNTGAGFSIASWHEMRLVGGAWTQ